MRIGAGWVVMARGLSIAASGLLASVRLDDGPAVREGPYAHDRAAAGYVRAEDLPRILERAREQWSQLVEAH